MRWKVVNVLLGLDNLYQSNFKCMPLPALAIGGIAAGAGTALAGLANLFSSSSANAANRDIAEMTNATNMEMNRQQIEFAREQYWNEMIENRFLVDQAYQRSLEDREYNSPANQARRLLAAGINPALALGQIQTGHVGVNATTGSPAHGNVPNTIPAQMGEPVRPLDWSGLGNGISQAVSAYYSGLANEREDYRLAADITFRDYQARQKSIDQLIELRKLGVDEKWIDAQIKDLTEKQILARDQFEYHKVTTEENQKIEKFRSQTERYAVEVQASLAESEISLSHAQSMRIASEISQIETETKEMVKNGISQRRINKYLADKENEIVKQLREETKSSVVDEKQLEGPFKKERAKVIHGIKKAVNILFSPIKGLVSVGIK